jgi:hypothetical protein
MNSFVALPSETVDVRTYTRGLLGPSQKMLGPVRDGGRIVTGTPPGCWGPMITPKFQGGHEVTQPVAVDGAEIGDAIAGRRWLGQRRPVTAGLAPSGEAYAKPMRWSLTD